MKVGASTPPPSRSTASDAASPDADFDGGLDADGAVTPLELFFDLVFVFAITQLTSALAHHPTPVGALQVVLLFGVLWWMYGGYAWLTNSVPPDRKSIRAAAAGGNDRLPADRPGDAHGLRRRRRAAGRHLPVHRRPPRRRLHPQQPRWLRDRDPARGAVQCDLRAAARGRRSGGRPRAVRAVDSGRMRAVGDPAVLADPAVPDPVRVHGGALRPGADHRARGVRGGDRGGGCGGPPAAAAAARHRGAGPHRVGPDVVAVLH